MTQVLSNCCLSTRTESVRVFVFLFKIYFLSISTDMQDLSSLIREGTRAPCIGSSELLPSGPWRKSLCVPFKSEPEPCWFLKPDLRGLVFPVQILWTWYPIVGCGSLAPQGGPLRLCYLSWLWVAMPEVDFGQTTPPPLLPVCLSVVSFYALSGRQSFFVCLFGRQSFILVFSYVSHRSLRYNCFIHSGGFCVTKEGQFQEFSALPSSLPPSARVAFPLVCFGRILLSYWKFHH